MEGLTGVRYSLPSSGPVEAELDFLDPPSELIDVLEYAMLNDLPITLPAGAVNSVGTVPLKILSIDVQRETHDIDATTYGSVNPTYIKYVIHRRVHVRARPA